MNQLRILHVTESHAREGGGLTTVVNDLTRYLYDLGVYSCVLAPTDNVEFVPDGVDFVPMGSDCNGVLALFSAELKNRIRRIVHEKKINVVHIHGFWMPLKVTAARVAKAMGLPVILTIHGMLEPRLWKNKGVPAHWKKLLYWKLIGYPVFKQADAIHAITPLEKESLKLLFPDNRIEVIPNAISVNQIDAQLSHMETPSPEPIILSLGRIHPKKGIDLLLRAFASAKLPAKWKLVIAGPEEIPKYARKLKQLSATLGLSDRVNFIGAIYGKEKSEWYKRSWVVAVPSHTETIGMVNLEAACACCPTITTHETGLYGWDEGGGILINPEIDQLAKALQECTRWTVQERLERGEASFNLIKQKYSWDIVCKQWVEFYKSLGGKT